MYLKAERSIAISKMSYYSLYQNVTEGQFSFKDRPETSEEKEERSNRCKLTPDCIRVLLM